MPSCCLLLPCSLDRLSPLLGDLNRDGAGDLERPRCLCPSPAGWGGGLFSLGKAFAILFCFFFFAVFDFDVFAPFAFADLVFVSFFAFAAFDFAVLALLVISSIIVFGPPVA